MVDTEGQLCVYVFVSLNFLSSPSFPYYFAAAGIRGILLHLIYFFPF